MQSNNNVFNTCPPRPDTSFQNNPNINTQPSQNQQTPQMYLSHMYSTIPQQHPRPKTPILPILTPFPQFSPSPMKIPYLMTPTPPIFPTNHITLFSNIMSSPITGLCVSHNQS